MIVHASAFLLPSSQVQYYGPFECLLLGSQCESFANELIRIPYTPNNFPAVLGKRFQGRNVCKCDWADVLWSAITVGKGQYQHLIRFGRYSRFEIVRRSALVFANLQQNALGDLKRTAVYDALDPSEKGATSYFLGLLSAKLFAEKYLGVTWLMHLDSYKDRLFPELARGKSRPDLVGFGPDGSWYVLEAKGRTGGRDNEALRRAKDQASRLLRVSGTDLRMRVGLVSSFHQDRLNIDWMDPDGDDQEPLYAEIRHEDLLYDYYKPLADLLDTSQEDVETTQFRDRRYFTTYIEEADLRIGMSQSAYIASSDPEREMNVENLSPQLLEDLPENIVVGQDGVYVELGPAWSTTEMMLEPTSRNRSH